MGSVSKRTLGVFVLAVAALAGLAYLITSAQRSPAPTASEPEAARGLPERASEEPSAQKAPRAAPAASAPSEPPAPTVESSWEQPDSPEAYWQELERLRKEDRETALSYALEGEKWYPDEGKPAEARRAMIVTLLVDLGRMTEARERTRAFIAQYPDSPYRRLVQGVTGIHPRPGAPAQSR